MDELTNNNVKLKSNALYTSNKNALAICYYVLYVGYNFIQRNSYAQYTIYILVYISSVHYF